MLERIFPSITLRHERTRLAIAEVKTARIAAQASEMILRESLPTYVRDPDEDEWTASSNSREPLDYSDHDLVDMWTAALDLSYRPGGRGLLDTMESFVIGEGAKVISQDEAPEVQDYWDEWVTANKWDVRQKEAFRRLLRDGELWLRWFKPGEKLEGVKKHLQVRFTEPNEIKDPANHNSWGHWSFGIETDPEDIEKHVAYYRYYYAIAQGNPSGTWTWERIEAAKMDFFKILTDANVKRGRSWLMGVAKYIRMHEQWLDQRFQLNRLRNLFAVIGNMKTVGTSDATTIKNKFTDTTGKTNTGEGTPKKMPSSALMLIQRGVEWDLKSLNINAADAAEDGRNFQLMICAGTGLTEYVVRGDSSNSSYASTMVSESPMVKMLQGWQDRWRDIVRTMHARVIKYGIETGDLSPQSYQTQEGQLRRAKRRLSVALREGRVQRVVVLREEVDDLQPDEKKDKQEPKGPKQIKPPAPKPEPKKVKVPTNTDCDVEFPPLIHRDIVAETNALTIHQNNKWAARETCSAAMGYDPDAETKKIQADDANEMAAAKQQDREEWS